MHVYYCCYEEWQYRMVVYNIGSEVGLPGSMNYYLYALGQINGFTSFFFSFLSCRMRVEIIITSVSQGFVFIVVRIKYCSWYIEF